MMGAFGMMLSGSSSGWPGSGGPGGGEEAPEWVPAGATAYVDFTNDPPRAWTSTGGTANDITDVVGDSVALGRTYDPAKVDPGVAYGSSGDPGEGAFIGEMVTAFNYDFTALFEFNDQLQIEYAETTNFATDLVGNYSATADSPVLDDQAGNRLNAADWDGGSDTHHGVAGAHKWAFTITASEMYSAFDGVSMLTNSLADDPDRVSNPDPSTPDQPTDIVFISSGLKTLTIYNPVKSEAELRTLTA